MNIELPDFNQSCIYAIWIDGRHDKCYIGKTVNYSIRAKRHVTDFKASRHGNKHLQRLYNKHESLNMSPIEICDKQSLSNREVFWVSFFKSKQCGYNMTSGGETTPDALVLWDDSRRKTWSEHCSKNPIALGTKKSDNWKKKMQASIEQRRKDGILFKHLNKKCSVIDINNNKTDYESIKDAVKHNKVAYSYLIGKLKKGGGTTTINTLTFTTNE